MHNDEPVLLGWERLRECALAGRLLQRLISLDFLVAFAWHVALVGRKRTILRTLVALRLVDAGPHQRLAVVALKLEAAGVRRVLIPEDAGGKCSELVEKLLRRSVRCERGHVAMLPFRRAGLLHGVVRHGHGPLALCITC